MEEVKDNVNDVDDNSFLDSELQALQAIYVNEIEVERENEEYTSISIHLHPATADNLDEQYVRMSLKFILDKKYPDVLPQINIRNPRGLSDKKLECIMQDLLSIAEDKKGTSMLFEMIEAAKEHLTAENRPSGECAICLYGFNEKDIFTRTECYHYFHSHCLARYSKNTLENSQDSESDVKCETASNELLCPMCRIPVHFEGSEDQFPPPVESIDDAYNISEEILEFQKRMADLYQKQVEKGGIIDIEAEKNKYLLEISNVPTRTNTAEGLKSAELGKICNESNNKTEDSGSGGSVSPSKDKTQQIRDKNPKGDFKSDGTINKYNEGRKNDKYDRRYNKTSDNNFRRDYFDKTNKKQDNSSNKRFSNRTIDHENDFRNIPSPLNTEAVMNASKNKDAEDSTFASEDLSSSATPENSKAKMSTSYTDRRFNKPRNDSYRRYGRGYNQTNFRTNNSYDSYKGNRRSDAPNGYSKSNFRDRYNNQPSQRYKSAVNGSEDTVQNVTQESENASWNQGNAKGEFGYRSRKENYNMRDFRSADRPDEYNYAARNSYSTDKSSRNDHFYCQDKRGGYSRRRGNFYHDNRGYAQKNSYATSNSAESGQAHFSGRYENNHSERNKRNQRRNKNYTEDEDKDYFDHSYNKNSQRDKYVKKNLNGTHSRQSSLQNESKVNPYNADWHSRSCTSDTFLDVNAESEQVVCNESEKIQKRERGLSAKSHLTENTPEHEELTDVSNNKAGLSHTECKTSHTSEEKESPITNISTSVSNKSQTVLPPPPGFANPLKKVIYGLQAANPPPGFHRS